MDLCDVASTIRQPLTTGLPKDEADDDAVKQGLPVISFSAQPKPFIVLSH
jgi:hypothetical protein